MFLNHLPVVRGEYRKNFKLAPLTWFKVGGPADLLFKPADLEDLSYFLAHITKDIPVIALGAGSNVLIRDGGIDGVVIKLGRAFSEIEPMPNQQLKIGAACLNYNVAQFCYKNSITGFEFLLGIPGSIGGGVAMNAGSYSGEFKDIVTSLEAVDRDGVVHNIPHHEIGFKYRANSLPKDLIFTSIICNYITGNSTDIKARMDEIMEHRTASQPVKEKTCGSTFMNLENQKVWQLIDKSGMRGAKVGGAEMSKMHCNFMINTGAATAKDLESLGDLVRDKVFKDSGIELTWEIKRIGKRI